MFIQHFYVSVWVFLLFFLINVYTFFLLYFRKINFSSHFIIPKSIGLVIVYSTYIEILNTCRLTVSRLTVSSNSQSYKNWHVFNINISYNININCKILNTLFYAVNSYKYSCSNIVMLLQYCLNNLWEIKYFITRNICILFILHSEISVYRL